jgi:hypothetical protein
LFTFEDELFSGRLPTPFQRHLLEVRRPLAHREQLEFVRLEVIVGHANLTLLLAFGFLLRSQMAVGRFFYQLLSYDDLEFVLGAVRVQVIDNIDGFFSQF